MDKIILHEHLKESGGPQSGNDFVERVSYLLVIGYGHSLDVSLDQDSVLGVFLEGEGEVYVVPFSEHFVESIQILHFEGEVDLFC